MKHPQTLCAVDTIYSADSVETCPANPNLLAVGTYQLRKKPGDDGSPENALPADRLGRLYLHSIDPANNSLPLVQQVEVPAILDMKWNPAPAAAAAGHHQQLAVANSIGQVQLWSLSADADSPPLVQLKSTIQVSPIEDNVLCLALDYSNRLASSSSSPSPSPSSATIAVSLSNGHLALLDPATATVTDSWQAHTLEAWSTAFDPHSHARTLYSGADDAHFSMWDTRSLARTSTNSRTHQAGVTYIAPSLADEVRVVTGSYDEYVRVWDKRQLRMPLREIGPMGGGAWRVRFDPNAPATRVVVAGMHAGFFVVDLDAEEGQEVTHGYEGHESLAYGVDWCGEGNGKVASCSFYDHALHLWEV